MTNTVAIISIGLASWFHPHRETAGGYPVCASRTIPRGSLVKITERHNGSCVVCRVDDWGPAKWTGCIIDLSPAAFEALDGLTLGRADVTIEVLTRGK